LEKRERKNRDGNFDGSEKDKKTRPLVRSQASQEPHTPNKQIMAERKKNLPLANNGKVVLNALVVDVLILFQVGDLNLLGRRGGGRLGKGAKGSLDGSSLRHRENNDKYEYFRVFFFFLGRLQIILFRESDRFLVITFQVREMAPEANIMCILWGEKVTDQRMKSVQGEDGGGCGGESMG